MRILCKMSCILCVYYTYIARILLLKIYSSQRTLSLKIRTINPRNIKVPGVFTDSLLIAD